MHRASNEANNERYIYIWMYMNIDVSKSICIYRYLVYTIQLKYYYSK